VKKLDKGNLYSVRNIDYGDKAWFIYRDWVMGVNKINL
jgi:hypothetical protein